MSFFGIIKKKIKVLAMPDDSERKYIPPEIKKAETPEVVSSGFVSLAELSRETSRGYEFLRELAGKYAAGHPEWIQTLPPKGKGRPGIHYSSELVSIIRQEVSKPEVNPFPIETLFGTEASSARYTLLAEYNRVSGGQFTRYEQLSSNKEKILQRFPVKTVAGEYSVNWNSIANRARSYLGFRISDKLIFHFLDQLAEGKPFEQAKAEVKATQQARSTEREKVQEARLSPEMFESPVLRQLLVEDYNKRTGDKATRYVDISVGPHIRAEFTIQTPDGKIYKDKWNLIHSRIRGSYKLGKISLKSTLKFIDLLADGKSIDDARSEVQEGYKAGKQEKERQRGFRIPVEIFSSADVAFRQNLKDVILQEYVQRTGKAISRYEDISTHPAVYDADFTIKIGQQEFTDSWLKICDVFKRKQKLKVSSKLIFRFLDLLAEGQSEEEARAAVESAHQTKSSEKEKTRQSRLSPEMFAVGPVKLRGVLLAEYNRRTQSQISSYEEMSAGTAVYYGAFTVSLEGNEYTDKWVLLVERISRKYDINTKSPKLIFRFLDLLVSGQSIEEARTLVLAADESAKQQREQEQEKRFSPELFLVDDQNAKANLRILLLTEYNKRTKANITRYQDVSTWVDVFDYYFTITTPEGKTYTDSWNAITERLNKYLRANQKLKVSQKMILVFLDLVADGKSLEEAKKEVTEAYQQKRVERESRVFPELFAEGDPASRFKLRELLVNDYNKRTGGTASKYADISTGTAQDIFTVKGEGEKDYIDSWNAIHPRFNQRYHLKFSKKHFFILLDLLADGKNLEEAKLEVASQDRATAEQEKTKQDFENEVKNIANNADLLSKFKIWVSIFGPHTATDILFAHHPKYKTVPEEFAKGIIADYLGDTLVQPPPFRPEDVQYIEKRFLENTNLQEGLYICLIQACSSHLSKHRANPKTAANILEQFMVEIGEKVPPDAQDLFLEIIVKVALYFRSVFDNWKRPANMINNIVEGRDFPDTTQIINILEIKEKKRLLIADRMGVGKSASAIAAKEFLGLKQANF
jgi:hypothetical protein